VPDALGEGDVPPADVADDVADGEVDVEADDVGVAVAQAGRVMTLSSRLTCPLRARTRPDTVVPVCTLADVSARMLPTNVVFVPRVAELPICQNTLHAWAEPTRFTVLLDAVMSVDPTWKMKTALGSPCASSVTVPVRPSADGAL
jgi:hypothetical protein